MTQVKILEDDYVEDLEESANRFLAEEITDGRKVTDIKMTTCTNAMERVYYQMLIIYEIE